LISIITVLSIGFALNLPVLFAYTIVPVANATNRFLVPQTWFGLTPFFAFYSIFVSIFQSFVTLVALALLNVFITIEFKRFIQKKKNLKGEMNMNNGKLAPATATASQSQNPKTIEISVGNIQQQQQQQVIPKTKLKANFKTTKNEDIERNFTIMILTSSLIYAITRLIDVIASILFEINRLNNNMNDLFMNLFRFLNISITVVYFGLNFPFNFAFNKVFKSCFKKMIRF
jgi:hypothetical protein